MTTTTRSALRQEIGLVSGACKTGTASTAGAAGGTTIVDTTNFTDSSMNANFYDNWYALLTSGTYSGQIRRVSSYAGATGTITVADAFGGQVASSVTFEIHSNDPANLNNAINRALPRLFYWTHFYPTLVTDGDMETSGTSNWTASSSAATKSTTIAKYGTQSLVSTNSGASGYLRTASMSVTPADNYYVEVAVRPDNFEVVLVLYDVTNAANITTVTHTGREWKRLWAYFTIPSGCRQIQVRLQATSATAVTYWDNLILQEINDKKLALPSWITEKGQVERLEYRLFQRAEATGVHFVDEEKWYTALPAPAVEEDRTAVSPFYLALPYSASNYPFRVVCIRPYDTLTTDSATTTANKEWVVSAALLEVMRLRRLRGPGSQVGDIQAQINAYRKDFQRLCRIYQPRIVRSVRSPWDA